MDFYNTVGGQRFVNHTIPSLINAIEESNKRKEQYVLLAQGDEYEVIKNELSKGSRFVTYVPNLTRDAYILIFEK